MTFKMILATAVLALAPTFAAAMGCSGYEHKQQTAMSCAEGMVLDPASGNCVAQITS